MESGFTPAMQFNPHTNTLLTDDGRLIKRLRCAFQVDWRRLGPTEDPAARRCDICQHAVTDTAQRTEQELLALMAAHPEACLKVDLYQDNLMVTYHDV